MSKQKAIEVIKEIQAGKWDRNRPKHIPKGRIAENMWNGTDFAYGMEYGAIAVLMQMFDITENDLE